VLPVVQSPQYPPPPASGDRLAGLPVPKIWMIFSHSVERLGELYVDVFTLELVWNVSCGRDNLPANFSVSATFYFRIMGTYASY